MGDAVDVRKQAMKQWKALPASPRRRIGEAIRGLGDDPRPPGSKKLTAQEGRRIRVGDYRVLYVIDDDAEVVTITHVAHRKDAY